jgi:hypothetical protein
VWNAETSPRGPSACRRPCGRTHTAAFLFQKYHLLFIPIRNLFGLAVAYLLGGQNMLPHRRGAQRVPAERKKKSLSRHFR